MESKLKGPEMTIDIEEKVEADLFSVDSLETLSPTSQPMTFLSFSIECSHHKHAVSRIRLSASNFPSQISLY